MYEDLWGEAAPLFEGFLDPGRFGRIRSLSLDAASPAARRSRWSRSAGSP